MKHNGSKTKIRDKEVYFTQKKFSTGKDVFLGDDLDPENIPQTDFTNLSEDEMWALINWITEARAEIFMVWEQLRPVTPNVIANNGRLRQPIHCLNLFHIIKKSYH